MEISYGGLSFRVINVNNFERSPVLDESGTDYLFTRFKGNLTAIVNSQANTSSPAINGPTVGMSYVQSPLGGPAPPNVLQTAASNAPITDRTIRHWLNVPRRPLTITDGPNILLQSPRAGRVCDSHNGPFIDVLSIESVLGEARTYIVNFQFTTYINECEEAEDKLYVLLTNRFSQTHSLDEDYGLTVKTEGSAYFRTDLMFGIDGLFPGIMSLNPDFIRDILFLPIPVGFKRSIDFVRGRSDASVIDYGFRDVQMPQQFPIGDTIGATRIEAVYKEAVTHDGDTFGMAAKSLERIYNFKWAKDASTKATVEELAEDIRRHRAAQKLADSEP